VRGRRWKIIVRGYPTTDANKVKKKELNVAYLVVFVVEYTIERTSCVVCLARQNVEKHIGEKTLVVLCTFMQV
jgi:hypothetical protein